MIFWLLIQLQNAWLIRNTVNSKKNSLIYQGSQQTWHTDLYLEIGCCDDDTIWLISVNTTQCDLPDTWRAQVTLLSSLNTEDTDTKPAGLLLLIVKGLIEMSKAI